jgi:tRNA (guanine37-N1)-methyltransferase
MKIDIITLFPDMFKGPFDMSMLLKARQKGLVEIAIHDLRQYGLGPRRTVDDTPYGGGDGMLLRPEPIFSAAESVQQSNSQPSKVAVLTPGGQPYNQKLAAELASLPGLILIAGHYEGFDERIMTLADYQISIGDYVLTGGELPAMVIVDSVVRLIPGVLGGPDSSADESFSEGLLEYPQYTRPSSFRGMEVPPVLQAGNHAEIKRWRQQQAKDKTIKHRPDLVN